MPPQPEPVLFPRRALDQRFAVLLLNSMYDAVDSLDFIPMVRAGRPHRLKLAMTVRQELALCTLAARELHACSASACTSSLCPGVFQSTARFIVSAARVWLA